MRLFQKAKKLGIWDPADIDFTQDKEDWKNATELELTEGSW
jgi:ribonucleoside-diphosphate reductase beta chain